MAVLCFSRQAPSDTQLLMLFSIIGGTQEQTPADAPVCPPSSHHLIQGAKQPCPTPAKSIRLGNVAVCLDIDTCACLSETSRWRLLLMLRSSVVGISMELVSFVSTGDHGQVLEPRQGTRPQCSRATSRFGPQRLCMPGVSRAKWPPRLPSYRCNLACATSTASLMVAGRDCPSSSHESGSSHSR